jgi:hypothetical protein
MQQDRQAVPVGLRRFHEAQCMIDVQVVRTVHPQEGRQRCRLTRPKMDPVLGLIASQLHNGFLRAIVVDQCLAGGGGSDQRGDGGVVQRARKPRCIAGNRRERECLLKCLTGGYWSGGGNRLERSRGADD